MIMLASRKASAMIVTIATSAIILFTFQLSTSQSSPSCFCLAEIVGPQSGGFSDGHNQQGQGRNDTTSVVVDHEKSTIASSGLPVEEEHEIHDATSSHNNRTEMASTQVIGVEELLNKEDEGKVSRNNENEEEGISGTAVDDDDNGAELKEEAVVVSEDEERIQKRPLLSIIDANADNDDPHADGSTTRYESSTNSGTNNEEDDILAGDDPDSISSTINTSDNPPLLEEDVLTNEKGEHLRNGGNDDLPLHQSNDPSPEPIQNLEHEGPPAPVAEGTPERHPEQQQQQQQQQSDTFRESSQSKTFDDEPGHQHQQGKRDQEGNTPRRKHGQGQGRAAEESQPKHQQHPHRQQHNNNRQTNTNTNTTPQSSKPIRMPEKGSSSHHHTHGQPQETADSRFKKPAAAAHHDTCQCPAEMRLPRWDDKFDDEDTYLDIFAYMAHDYLTHHTVSRIESSRNE
jgi:hypothetical protein